MFVSPLKREWEGWTRRERHKASCYRLCPESAEGRGPQKGGVSIMKLSVASWMTVAKHIIWMVQVHSLGISRERLILTMSILIHQEGWIFWSIPRDRIYDEKLSTLHTPPKLGRYWEIYPHCPRDFPQPLRFLFLHLQAKLLKRVGIYVEEDLTKGTKEKRSELRKFARQVLTQILTQDRWQILTNTNHWGLKTLQVKKNHPEKLCHLLYDQLHVGGGAVFVFNEALGQVVQLQDESRSHVNVVKIFYEKQIWD